MVLKLIDEKRVHIYFQPIISIRSAKIIGVEALMRAYDEHDEPLSPIFVFEQAKKENLSFELDKYVRKETWNDPKILDTFETVQMVDNDLIKEQERKVFHGKSNKV